MRTLESQVVRRNFLRTTNPFNLEDPPTWFLDRLAALDSELVIFASTHEPVYRLCRRKKHTRGVFRVVKSFPDTAICVAHRMDPWKSLLPTSLDMSWARVLEEIPQYDQWRVGRTGDQVADHLERLEAQREQRENRQQKDDLDQLGSYSYRVTQRALGSRTGLSDRPWAGMAPA